MTIFGGGDPIFDTNPRSIVWMLQEIEAGRFGLPDFQRDFVWDPSAVRDLLVSVMCRYPAGALLTLKQRAESTFKPREFEGAPALTSNPSYLILDGQQRLTSLYQAHKGVGDARYMVKLGLFVDNDAPLSVEEVPFDEFVVFEVVRRGRPPQSENEQWQYENWTFPVSRLGTSGFDRWVEAAVAHHGGEAEVQLRRRLRLADVRDHLLVPLTNYNFPVVELDESTSLGAVCKIFETLNLRGITLSVFELITARVWADGQNLRDLWETAKQEHPILKEFKVDAYSVLQAITLRSVGSAQRSKVLELRAENVQAHWEPVVRGFSEALGFLQSQCKVMVEKWLPYAGVVTPMAAAWDVVSALPSRQRGDAKERLKQFFWCSVFMTNYDQGGNSQAQADYGVLRTWLPAGEGDAPEAIRDFNFSASQLANAKVNRRALYRGTMVLVLNKGALDFHSRLQLTPAQMRDGEVDAHHLFPRNWLAQNYAPHVQEPLSSELIVNRALIDGETNGVILDHAPSDYLAQLSDPNRDRVLHAHIIDEASVAALLADDYPAFVKARTAALLDEIEAVTGRPVTRDL